MLWSQKSLLRISPPYPVTCLGDGLLPNRQNRKSSYGTVVHLPSAEIPVSRSCLQLMVQLLLRRLWHFSARRTDTSSFCVKLILKKGVPSLGRLESEKFMVSKCANPSCGASFQYLRSGKLFLLDLRHSRPVSEDGSVPRQTAENRRHASGHRRYRSHCRRTCSSPAARRWRSRGRAARVRDAAPPA